MIVRLAFSILCANLVLVFGAGILLAVGVTFGPVWWGLYALGTVLGALVSENPSKEVDSGSQATILRILAVLFLHALCLFFACGLAAQFIDVGWDSLETHQRGVLLIREGWNIVNPQPGWLGQQPADGLLRIEPSVFTAYLDFNAMYVVSSLMADLPFGLEGAKGYRLVILLMAGVLSAHVLRRAGLGKWAAAAVGLFVAANPVCLYQMWVLFMDFDVAIYSTLAVVSIYALSWKGDRRAVWISLAAILLLLVSKRSGVAFSAPLGGVLVLWFIGAKLGWWLNRNDDSSEKASPVLTFLRSRKGWMITGSLGLIAVMGILIILGSSGRQRETRQGQFYSLGFIHRAIFEPDLFDKNLDLVVPSSHRGLSRPFQFGRSLLEKTDIYRGDSMKVPLTWASDEWQTFRNLHWPGHGSGGFGPLFSGVLLLAIFAWLLAARPWPPLLTGGSLFRMIFFLSIIGICFVLPSWWARWVPFIWILPLFFLIPPLFLRPQGDSRFWLLLADRNHLIPSLLSASSLILAVINSTVLFWIVTDESHRVSRVIDETLESLSGQQVILEPGRNLLTKRWLIEREIEYQISNDRGNLIFEMEPSTSRLYELITPQ